MPFELNVTVKNSEKRMTKKHFIYEKCEVSEEDPIIKGAIQDAVKEFGEEPDDIRVKITLEVK